MQSLALTRALVGWAPLLLSVACLSAGCGKTSSGGSQLGGETHFLGGCAEGCGELSCIEGICTRPCSSAAACTDLNAAAVCRFDSGADGQGFCDVACASEVGCSGVGTLSCQAGYCRVPPGSAPAQVDSATTDTASDSSPSAETGEHSPAELLLTPAGLPLRCARDKTLVGDVRVDSRRALETLEGCEEITGRLAVVGTTDLRSLHSLRRVGGVMTLAPAFSESTLSFAGLEQLESLGGLNLSHLKIEGVRELANLRHLETLELRFVDLIDLSAFRNATGIRSLQLGSNPALTTLDGLASDALRDVVLESNPALTDLEALSGVTALNELTIGDMPIENLDALSGVQTIYSMQLRANPLLENLDALADLEFGQARIEGNGSLTHLPAFSRLSELVIVLISDNQRLESIAFPALQLVPGSSTGGGIIITGNPALTRVELPRLEVSDELTISENAALSELSLPVLQNSARLTISNTQLTRLQLPAFVSALSFNVQRNERLSSVEVPGLQTSNAYSDLLDLVIALNPVLEQDAIDVGQAKAARIRRVAANSDIAATGSALSELQLDPCPWQGDGYCDACASESGYPSTGTAFCATRLCAGGTDPQDCVY